MMLKLNWRKENEMEIIEFPNGKHVRSFYESD